ncbi:MAG: hypothetical protein R6U66_14300 [Bacteroidales bacterium]
MNRAAIFPNLFYLLVGILLLLPACEGDDLATRLPDDGYYTGTFYAPDYHIEQDSVFLTISNGYYRCDTRLPYNFGAGRLEVTGTTFNFVDTLFFAIPAMYITGFALSGEYAFQVNGRELLLEKAQGSGKLRYQLFKEE